MVNIYYTKKSTVGFCWRWIFCLFSKSVIPIFVWKIPPLAVVSCVFGITDFLV